ncbi:large conductance mechanosensitive channel protein MscL [Niallia sp. NCCP-28]|uniref:large conductance mechanosensitive channel protein MscL n=1 Tax=Niallia sp. NCCP-28 TaxID=2934712 RepID=UPI00208ABDF9|nr:large conductance mechanosensitive channel protein MscL [Niallia sp. NCCP-28]GKU84427.1 large-conductance mechanosensitive channel [Niallia sp. NCCP-28]
MWNDFKQFAIKGNVVDLAVGVIIGTAFSKIVSSLVNDVIMPIIGVLIGGIDFTSLIFRHGTAIIKYGTFIQTILDFFIIAFSIFLFVKLINKLKKKEEIKEEEKKTDATEELLMEIRDLLKGDIVREK